MNIQKHDLHHEFPEYYDEIHNLKMNNNHFAKIFKQYHELDHEVIRIEEGVENTSDDYLEELKKQRLHYKDELFLMIKKYQASNA
ncbi:MAG: YdcH family protein [Thalassotalea sp.]|nr:YdcH family protein [Thalassotalea sp.]MDG2394118.1 YdcH family protein [Thalassotalea sp.]